MAAAAWWPEQNFSMEIRAFHKMGIYLTLDELSPETWPSAQGLRGSQGAPTLCPSQPLELCRAGRVGPLGGHFLGEISDLSLDSPMERETEMQRPARKRRRWKV